MQKRKKIKGENFKWVNESKTETRYFLNGKRVSKEEYENSKIYRQFL